MAQHQQLSTCTKPISANAAAAGFAGGVTPVATRNGRGRAPIAASLQWSLSAAAGRSAMFEVAMRGMLAACAVGAACGSRTSAARAWCALCLGAFCARAAPDCATPDKTSCSGHGPEGSACPGTSSCCRPRPCAAALTGEGDRCCLAVRQALTSPGRSSHACAAQRCANAASAFLSGLRSMS